MHGKGVEPLRLAAAEPKAPIEEVTSAEDGISAGDDEAEPNVSRYDQTSDEPETPAETRLRDVAAVALGYIEAGRLDRAKDILREFLES